MKPVLLLLFLLAAGSLCAQDLEAVFFIPQESIPIHADSNGHGYCLKPGAVSNKPEKITTGVVDRPTSERPDYYFLENGELVRWVRKFAPVGCPKF